MQKRLGQSLVVLLLAVGLFAVPWIHTVAAAGSLYVSPSSVGLLPVDSTFSVQVKVSGMDQFNGWEIQVSSDPSVISPTNISTAGNIFLANTTGGIAFELRKCVNGSGSGCCLTSCAPLDGPGIADSAYGYTKLASGSGLLFSVNFQVVGNGPYSPIIIQNDVFSNSGNSGVVHTTTSSIYGVPPDFTIAATPTNVIAPPGVLSGSFTIMVTGVNGFTGTVGPMLTSSSGLTCSVTPSALSLNSTTTSASAVLSCSVTASGTYTAIVNGTSAGFPNEASHVAHVTFIFTALTFQVSASRNYFVAHSENGRVFFFSVITVTSQGSFSGKVSLTASSSPSSSSFLFLFPTRVTLVADRSVQAFLFGSVGPHAASGTYTITVTGTSGATNQSATITVIIPSENVDVSSLTWTHPLSLASSGGSQTWVATIQNTGSTAQYVQVVITGIGRGGTYPFTTQSAIVLVGAGATVNITVSTPTGAFTSSDTGQTFYFQARAFFGISSSSLNNVSQDMPNGRFTVVN